MDDVLHPNLIEEIQKLGSLIKDFKVAMMTTLDENGKMHSRPMLTQQVEFEGDLWFFTSVSSHKIAELNWNRQVHIDYSMPEKNRFISVSGTGQIIRDPKRIEHLWRPLYHDWFPKGSRDPDLILLKVEVDQAEYWESTSSAAAQVIEIGKSALDAQGHKREIAAHKKIDLAS
jgi:general stress protein 26